MYSKYITSILKVYNIFTKNMFSQFKILKLGQDSYLVKKLAWSGVESN